MSNSPVDSELDTRSTNGSKVDALIPFHDKIVEWRRQEVDLRTIASRLNAQGCPVPVDFNVVARYCKKHRIVAGNPAAEEPSPAQAEADKPAEESGPSLHEPTSELPLAEVSPPKSGDGELASEPGPISLGRMPVRWLPTINVDRADAEPSEST
jgi:hypothetical protein